MIASCGNGASVDVIAGSGLDGAENGVGEVSGWGGGGGRTT